MKFVNRETELRRLKALAGSPPALVIVRGRRRVGKSFLLSEAFKGSRAVSFQADETDEALQLETLAEQVVRQLGLAGGLAFRNWDEALDLIEFEAKREKLNLVLDEFQYLCEAQPALPSIIQRHWDRWQRAGVPVCLVICGSALSFMEGMLTQSRPLYGRADYMPVIEPFDFRRSAELAAAGAGPTQLIERYGVLGGTPQYQVWAGRDPLSRILRESILSRGSPLYEEPLNLVRQESGVRDAGTYFAALHAIARGRTKTGEVAGTLRLSASHTYRLLEKLKALKYVELMKPLEPKQKTARAYWRILDPYFRFWFRYVFPNRSRLEAYRSGPVLEDINGDLNTYTGHIFEDCCRQWLLGYSGIEAAQSCGTVGSWWSRDGQTEVDIAGCEEFGYTLLASCKWTRSVGTSVLDRLYDARAVIGKPAAQAELMIFGREHFTKSLEERAEAEGVRLVTARELFQ